MAAPAEWPPFNTSEATDGVEDAGVEAAAVEETDDDVNRSPESISGREKINVFYGSKGNRKGLWDCLC